MKNNKNIDLKAVALGAGLCVLLLPGCQRERVIRAEISPVKTITHESFQNIDSVVLDEAGRVYVSDLNRVKVFDSDGVFITDIGTPGNGDGQFINEVIGLAINSQQELYVVDQDGSRVQVFDLEGKFQRQFGQHGSNDGQFLEPQGITIDKLDLVYVSDKLRNDIQVFSRKGEFLYLFGKSGTPGSDLNEPESMAIDKGKLYVADEENQRIQIYDLRGRHLGHLPHSGVFNLDSKIEASLDDVIHQADVENKFNRHLDGDIEGVAFDGRGILFILNEDQGEIMVFKQEKMVGILTSVNPIISGDGLAFDHRYQHLYVVDQGNARIQVFDARAIGDLLGL